MTVTRPIIRDLWSAYTSGEASAETRALVDDFLRDDPEFARQLRDDPLATIQLPTLPPEVEMRSFARAKRRLGGYRWMLFTAMFFSASAFARIVSDTSFDVSPRRFIITAAIAVAFWILFFVTLWRMRARIMIAPE
jgi:hypothetical protein